MDKYYKQKKESENRLTNKEKKVSTLISQEINELSKDLTNEVYDEFMTGIMKVMNRSGFEYDSYHTNEKGNEVVKFKKKQEK